MFSVRTKCTEEILFQGGKKIECTKGAMLKKKDTILLN